MVTGTTVHQAIAYFTTYTAASGSAVLHLGFTTTIPDEEVSDWTKHVSIQNTGDKECYVRVKAFVGELYEAALTYTDTSGKWSAGEDGYYYYRDILAPDFNVIVVQECTAVLYDENGQPYYDWSILADTGEVQE